MKRNFISILIVLTLMGLLGLAEMSLAVEGRWTEKADMPTPRSFPSASMVNGTIYAIGGMFANGANNTTVLPTVEAYNPLTDTWEEKADMPTARLAFSTAVVDGKIYAIGGTTTGGTWLGISTVEAYDPKTDAWITLTDMPTPRFGLTVSAVDGIIYAIGGGVDGADARSTVEAYDPETDIWATVADMPTPRSLPGATVVNGKIYVISGFGQRRGNWGLPPLPAVEAYDPVTDNWTTLPDMPTKRATSGVAESNGMVYTIGGSRVGNPWPAISIVEVYNPETATWASGPNMPTSRARVATSVVDGTIYVIGGSTAGFSNGFSTVEAFIPKGGSAVVSPQGKLVTTWSAVKQERIRW